MKQKVSPTANNFHTRVYKVVQEIPYGKVASYGTVACLAGNPRAARVVGWALHHNPEPDTIPCYRVVNRDGRLAPAFAFGGESAQRALLEKEGVTFDKRGNVKKEHFI